MKINCVLIIILASILMAAPGCTSEMAISGKVAVAGHEPFTYVRIIDQKNIEYKLVGPKGKILKKYFQNQVLTLHGKVVKKAIGPGFPAEFEVSEIVGSQE